MKRRVKGKDFERLASGAMETDSKEAIHYFEKVVCWINAQVYRNNKAWSLFDAVLFKPAQAYNQEGHSETSVLIETKKARLILT